MSYDPVHYHSQREAHCRALAEQACDPDIRRRHEQLAALHADHASRHASMANLSGEIHAA